MMWIDAQPFDLMGNLRDFEESQDLLGLTIVEMTLCHPYGQLRWQAQVLYLSGGWGSGSSLGSQ